MNDEKLFAQVARELSAGFRDESLWLKAFSIENGHPEKTKAHYVRLRIAKLLELDQGKVVADSSPAKREYETSPRNFKGRSVAFVLFLAAVVIGYAVLSPRPDRPKVTPKPETALPRETQPLDPFEEMRLAGITVNPDTATVFLTGEITSATARQFHAALANPSMLPADKTLLVFLDSAGGDLYAAMAIGREMRKRDSGNAAAVMENAKCYSACVFILAAGTQRIRRGSIGIHRPYNAAPSTDQAQSERWFAKISSDARAYLREMRVREDLFDDMVGISPSDIHIFQSTGEMDRYGLIAVDPVTEEKIAAAWMKKYGITDRAELMRRKADMERACSPTFQHDGRNYTLQECFDAFLSGKLALQ